MLEFLQNEVDPVLSEFEHKLYEINTQNDFDAFLEYQKELLSNPALTERQRQGIRRMSESLYMLGFDFKRK